MYLFTPQAIEKIRDELGGKYSSGEQAASAFA